MDTLKTTVRVYSLDTANPVEAEAYDMMCKRLKAEGLKCFDTRSLPREKSHYEFGKPYQGKQITLQAEHLFSNQWNTAEGFRAFDWAENIGDNPAYKRGYYLDQTPAMRAVRHNTLKCRYCGAQKPAESGLVFCPECIGSEYLKEKHLPMTRLMRVDDTSSVPALTDAERAHLVPKFLHAQLHGATERDKARHAKRRADIETEYKDVILHAEHKHKCALWLMDHAPQVYENWIYYKHTGRHCFGWRKPLDEAETAALLNVVCEFPGDYDIKREGARDA